MSAHEPPNTGERAIGLKRRSVILMILLLIVTLGFYYPIWFLRRRAALNRLDSPRKLQRWPFLVLLAYFVFDFIFGFVTASRAPEETVGAGGATLLISLRLAVGILVLIQCFSIRQILEDHLAGPDDTVPRMLSVGRVELSGLLTFLFTIFYLQYAINRYIVDQPSPA